MCSIKNECKNRFFNLLERALSFITLDEVSRVKFKNHFFKIVSPILKSKKSEKRPNQTNTTNENKISRISVSNRDVHRLTGWSGSGLSF